MKFFPPMFTRRPLTSTAIAMATGYSLLVEYSQLRKDSATGQGAQYDVNLDVGSVDDQLQDSLRPGDVLLIRREPYRHHIPTALALIAYHWLYQSDFDLSAVVVRDPSSHRVKVLQPTRQFYEVEEKTTCKSLFKSAKRMHFDDGANGSLRLTRGFGCSETCV